MFDAGADVYTVEEIARAAGVPTAVVRAFATSGDLPSVRGSRYFAEQDVVRIVPTLRALAVMTVTSGPPAPIFTGPEVPAPRPRYTLFASMGAHLTLLALALWLTADAPETAGRIDDEPARMVFLTLPGAGGGGGGSGARAAQRAPKLLSAGGKPAALATPPAVLAKSIEPAEVPPPPVAPAAPVTPAEAPPPPPTPPQSVVAPVITTASANQDRAGVVEQASTANTPSLGTGTGGRAGNGQGTGNGDGLGSGIGNGSGGGTGGGPYRPGSGIQPPRLLREVKADYTEEARRRGITGDVALEIVVKRDGSVGEITVIRGLGLGLDQKAIAAVRQWQFQPARRLGEPVDVIVEVSVEFKLR